MCNQADALKASFAKQEYAAVVTSAPAVLRSARVATAAAARRTVEVAGRFRSAAPRCPQVAAVQYRIDERAKTGKKSGGGFERGEGRRRRDRAVVQAGGVCRGNLDETVGTAKVVKAIADAASLSLIYRRLNARVPRTITAAPPIWGPPRPLIDLGFILWALHLAPWRR